MSVTVTFSDTTTFSTLEAFFTDYADVVGDADYEANSGTFAGEEDDSPLVDTGFWGSLFTFSGTQYAYESGNDDQTYGFIIETTEGEYLNYTFFSAPTHTIYGEIASITFGTGLVESDGEYSFSEEIVTIDGLDTVGLNAGIDENGDVINRGEGNDTHEIIEELQNGDSDALLAAIGSDYSVDYATTVGVAEYTDDALIAA